MKFLFATLVSLPLLWVGSFRPLYCLGWNVAEEFCVNKRVDGSSFPSNDVTFPHVYNIQSHCICVLSACLMCIKHFEVNLKKGRNTIWHSHENTSGKRQKAIYFFSSFQSRSILKRASIACFFPLCILHFIAKLVVHGLIQIDFNKGANERTLCYLKWGQFKFQTYKSRRFNALHACHFQTRTPYSTTQWLNLIGTCEKWLSHTTIQCTKNL